MAKESVPQTNFPVTDINKFKFPKDMDEYFKQFNKNFEALSKQDEEAAKQGKLVGRVIQEQIADGYAYYVIIRENKKTVRIRRATGLGDDWTIPYWGDEATIEKNYVLNQFQWKEDLAKIMAKG
jgi:hypothetical protein